MQLVAERLQPLSDVITALHNTSSTPHLQFLRGDATSAFTTASTNLADIIAKHASSDSQKQALIDAHPLNAADVIGLRALGAWADVVLHATHSRAIVSALSLDVLSVIFNNTLGVFLGGNTIELPPPTNSAPGESPVASRFVLQDSKTNALDAELRVWPQLERARRHALQVALSARYGKANLAPKAAMVAGAPLILFICERQCAENRVIIANSSRRQHAKEHAIREWGEIAMGLCVLEVLEVDSASSLRSSVGSLFKDAVWNKGLSPTLIVLHLEPDSTLCDGVGVLRAICDAYGSRLHVEGPATGMFLAGREAESLEHDIALSASSAHSIVMDVASWLGVQDAAVVSSVRLPRVSDASMNSAELAPVNLHSGVCAENLIPLWFLLQCCDMQKRVDMLKSACRHMNAIIDTLLEFAHLIEYRLVGCGEYLLLSYARNSTPISSKSALNRAMFAHVTRHSKAHKFHLQLAQYEGMDWLCFSPLLGLQSKSVTEHIQSEDVSTLSSLLVGAVKRCEMAQAGRAAFVASMKQCANIELVSHESDDPEAVMHFAALRVVPLGIAAGNGHWQRDSEMCDQVEKFTYALGTCLETAGSDRYEGVLADNAKTGAKPFVYIGPVVNIQADSAREDNLDEAELGVRVPWRLFGPGSTPAGYMSNENPHKGSDDAREIARDAASSVAALVQTVITKTKITTEDVPNENLISEPIVCNKEREYDAQIVEKEIEFRSQSEDVVEAESVELDEDDRFSGIGDQAPQSDPSTDGIASIAPEMGSTIKQEKEVQESNGDNGPANAKRMPLWSLFFGRAFGHMYDDDDSESDSSSLIDDQELEDDYFRL